MYIVGLKKPSTGRRQFCFNKKNCIEDSQVWSGKTLFT